MMKDRTQETVSQGALEDSRATEGRGMASSLET